MSYKVEKIPFYHDFKQKEGTAVAGTWVWTTSASQTDYASLTGEGAGWYRNSTLANLDEYKWSNIYLTKGTYKITIIFFKYSDRGIAEVLYGTTSLGTQDMYAAASTFNQTWTITFTLQSDTTADLRFRSNDKNALSTGYEVDFSRFQLEKTG